MIPLELPRHRYEANFSASEQVTAKDEMTQTFRNKKIGLCICVSRYLDLPEFWCNIPVANPHVRHANSWTSCGQEFVHQVELMLSVFSISSTQFRKKTNIWLVYLKAICFSSRVDGSKYQIQLHPKLHHVVCFGGVCSLFVLLLGLIYNCFHSILVPEKSVQLT